MKYLFIIQGEGRGHFFQAVALKELLEKYNHNICDVFISYSKHRSIPKSIKDQFNHYIDFNSPNFVYHKDHKRISLFQTIKFNILNIFNYTHSVRKLSRYIKEKNPDVVINFYEPLYGICQLFGLIPKHIKSYTIGHQFMFLHPDYTKSKKYCFQFQLAKLYTMLVGYKSEKIALSFYKARDLKNIKVIPPILRKELFNKLNQPLKKEHILVYLINPSYVEYFLNFVSSNTHIKIFTNVDDIKKYPNITVYPLNGEMFLSEMVNAQLVVCTAGFETVSEALYLDKTVLMCPVEGHMEQWVNAKDAENNVGNCKKLKSFSDWKFHTVTHDFNKTLMFRNWVDSGEKKLKEILRLK